MSWYKIDKIHRLAFIIMTIMGLFGMAIARPFLANPYWILTFDIVNPVLLFLVGFNIIIYGIEEIKEEMWRKFQKEYNILEKE